MAREPTSPAAPWPARRSAPPRAAATTAAITAAAVATGTRATGSVSTASTAATATIAGNASGPAAAATIVRTVAGDRPRFVRPGTAGRVGGEADAGDGVRLLSVQTMSRFISSEVDG